MDPALLQLGTTGVVCVVLYFGIRWLAGQLRDAQAVATAAQAQVIAQCEKSIASCAAERVDLVTRVRELEGFVRGEMKDCIEDCKESSAEQSQAMREQSQALRELMAQFVQTPSGEHKAVRV
jgi:hypothetical protein